MTTARCAWNTTTTIADTNMVVMNVNPPKLLAEGFTFDWGDVLECTHKYKKFNHATVAKFPWQARRILDKMEEYLEVGYKSTLVDFKVRDLHAGDCGCMLDGWHIDVVRNPAHVSRSDKHIIYTTIVGTEFMLDKVECSANDFADIVLPDSPSVWQAPPNAIVQFDRFNLHRGPVVQHPCTRVLIRLTQTDVF